MKLCDSCSASIFEKKENLFYNSWLIKIQTPKNAYIPGSGAQAYPIQSPQQIPQMVLKSYQ
jgi:hypothetical protein